MPLRAAGGKPRAGGRRTAGSMCNILDTFLYKKYLDARPMFADIPAHQPTGDSE
jgi:hypothetical protein